MKPVIITADSTADLSVELCERYGIHIIPLKVILGDESYLDGVSFSSEDIYRRYHADKTLPQTAAPGMQDFTDFFTPFLNDGCEIVHLDISAGISNSYNAARLAASELEGVYVIDSTMLSMGVGLLAIEGAECRDKGMSAAEIAAHLDELKGRMHTSFVLDTLAFMWKGGRCSGVSALGANLLNIKPALEMRDGLIVLWKKYRGSMKSVYRKYFTEVLEGIKVMPGRVAIVQSGEVEDDTMRELEELARTLTGESEVISVCAGCTVASHCGPRTIGLFYIEG